MGAIDVVDQELKYYNANRKTDRWTFKFTIHLLQTMLWNSYVLYKEKTTDDTPLRFMDYILVAIEWFIDIKNENITFPSTNYEFCSANDTNDYSFIPCSNENNDSSNKIKNYCQNLTETNSSSKYNNYISKSIKCVDKPTSSTVRGFSDLQNPIGDIHFDTKLHVPSASEKRLRCFVCYKKGIESKSIWHCSICDKSLCIKKSWLCWFEYHKNMESESSSLDE